MTGDCHVRFGERLEGKFLRSTQLDGQILFELKNPYNDGTTHLRFSPEQFIEKLVAIIPPPRFNLIRYHGGFAPNSPMRKQIVPEKEIDLDKISDAKKCQDNHDNLDNKFFWADLFRRTFKIDVLICDNCGGKMRIIGVVVGHDPVKKVLSYLKLPVIQPKIAPARPPPFFNFD